MPKNEKAVAVEVLDWAGGRSWLPK